MENLKNDVGQTFTNEDGNLVRLASDFYYDKLLNENYIYADECIHLKIPYDESISSHIELVKSQKPELLTKMLTLREKLSPRLFESPTNLFLSGSITSEKDREEIINWCKTNGYPFDITDKLKTDSPKTKSIFSKLKPDTFISFAITDFICQLNEVYCSFHMYKFFVGLTNSIEPILYAKGFNKNKNDIDGFLNLNKLSKEECKKLFEYKYQNIVFQNTISFSNETHFNVKTRNLFDAAFYQLALLLSVGNQELKICPLCNTYFVPKHARQKYCGVGCYPQKAHKRKKSAEKKKQLNQQG